MKYWRNWWHLSKIESCVLNVNQIGQFDTVHQALYLCSRLCLYSIQKLWYQSAPWYLYRRRGMVRCCNCHPIVIQLWVRLILNNHKFIFNEATEILQLTDSCTICAIPSPCVVGAQIQNKFRLWMVQSCSVGEWFGFWMVVTFLYAILYSYVHVSVFKWLVVVNSCSYSPDN